MRIERLHLDAFGAFSGTVLDFGSPSRGLQIVYGRNAAGKSTTLRAVLDLLFGIPDRSTDGFAHGNKALRIGARLVAADGRTLDVERRKGRKDTLRDPVTGRPVAEALLAAVLGGIGREQFAATFGLDHDRLRQGAQDLLATGGALGATLFDASSGTRSVRVVVEEIDQEASAVFSPRGVQPALNAAIRDYDDALKRSRDVLRADAFEDLERRRDALGAKIAAHDASLEAKRIELSRLGRCGRNLPRIAARAQLLAELGTLADVPELPEDAASERVRLLEQVRRLRTQIDGDVRNEERLVREIGQRTVPLELLAEADEIAAVWKHSGSIDKAAEDLARRRVELASRRSASARRLEAARAGLGIEDAIALRPAEPLARRIAELAESRSGIGEAVEGARDARDRCERQLEAQRRELDAIPPARDVARLAACCEEVARRGDLEARIADATGKAAELRRRATSLLATLPVYSGSTADLERLVVPLGETVRRFEERLREAGDVVARARRSLREARERLARIREDRERLRGAGEVPSVAARDRARALRDRGWELIRRAFVDGAEDVSREARDLDPGRALPDAFETQMRNADEIADRILDAADRVARDGELARQEAAATAAVADGEVAVADAVGAESGAVSEWRAIWSAVGIEAQTPAEMREWLDRRDRILVEAEKARVAEAGVAELAAQRAVACDELAASLAAHDVTHRADDPLATLLASAREAVGHAAAVEQQRVRAALLVEQRAADLREAEARLQGARNRLEQWTSDWRAATSSLAFAADASPTEVGAFLECVRDAVSEHEKAADLERRIEAMEEDVQRFGERVAGLVGRIDPSLAGREPALALRELHARLEVAREERGRLVAMQKESSELRSSIESRTAELRGAEDELSRVLARAGAATAEEAEAIERRATRRRQCVHDLQRVEREMVTDGAGLNLEQMVAEAAALDADAIAARRQQLEDGIHEETALRDACLEDRVRTQQELAALQDRDEAAATAAQEAADALAVVRHEALRYARLRLEARVLRDFVESHRQRHEGPMLARARALFSALTLGTFSGLRTDSDEKNEAFLLGVTEAGDVRLVAEMSDGTRDQLYLALRIAAIEQHAAHAEPLPFVADDLLVNFDDDRARATLTILAELGRTTQVLFFTHHRHLVDLARDVVPGELLGVQEIGAEPARARAAAAGVGVAAD